MLKKPFPVVMFLCAIAIVLGSCRQPVASAASAVGAFEGWLFQECFHNNNDKACRELRDGYWDRRIWSELGSFRIEDFGPPPPCPFCGDYEHDMKAWIADLSLSPDLSGFDYGLVFQLEPGDPTPQPSLEAVMLSRDLYLQSARRIEAELSSAAIKLRGDIERVEAELEDLPQ